MEKHDYGVDYPLNGGSDKVKRGMCTVLVMCRNATLDLAQLTGGVYKTVLVGLRLRAGFMYPDRTAGIRFV